MTRMPEFLRVLFGPADAREIALTPADTARLYELVGFDPRYDDPQRLPFAILNTLETQVARIEHLRKRCPEGEGGGSPAHETLFAGTPFIFTPLDPEQRHGEVVWGDEGPVHD